MSEFLEPESGSPDTNMHFSEADGLLGGNGLTKRALILNMLIGLS